MITKWDCLNFGGDWTNSIINFDNIINALVSLFTSATIAGWSTLMYQCASSTSIDYLANPTSQASPVWILFFIIFIIIGSFFFLNLFCGVVISTFNSEHEKIGGNDLLTEK